MEEFPEIYLSPNQLQKSASLVTLLCKSGFINQKRIVCYSLIEGSNVRIGLVKLLFIGYGYHKWVLVSFNGQIYFIPEKYNGKDS